ncbi:SSI family serine proteinase inhibitor [Streptomyces lateritius]|uniref:SSI family serine proteinase inhibitor n=1 Tax=Streptomyces lateritius TaxID=67313 RepID=A0ABW6YFS3_9ACTN
MFCRRPARATALTTALVTALSAAVLCGTATAAPPVPGDRTDRGDRLTVVVSESGDPARDGTYELYCHPADGDHPEARAACERLDALTVWGGPGPFAPVPEDALCTMQHGGPAVAHVEGTWAGRPVNADFARENGCEIGRWDALVPFLPAADG